MKDALKWILLAGGAYLAIRATGITLPGFGPSISDWEPNEVKPSDKTSSNEVKPTDKTSSTDGGGTRTSGLSTVGSPGSVPGGWAGHAVTTTDTAPSIATPNSRRRVPPRPPDAPILRTPAITRLPDTRWRHTSRARARCQPLRVSPLPGAATGSHAATLGALVAQASGPRIERATTVREKPIGRS